MMYSRWQPDSGEYVYYQTSERRGLGDDLPVPRLPIGTAIGVSSVAIGRGIPLGAKIVGSGPLPQGSIAPTSRAGLAGLGGALDVLPVWGWLVLGVAIGWVARHRWKS